MNYRDLQNISNLSQQILVEGANEDHNVLNRWPYTSPYLQENDSQVYENHQLDEKSVSWDTGRNASGVSPRDAAARRQAQLQSSSNPADQVRASQISSIRGNMRSAIQATGSNKLQSAGPIASERFKNAAIRQRGGSPSSVPVRTVPGLKDANKPAQTRRGGGSSAQGAGSPSGTGRYTPGGGQGYGISGIKLADSYDLYDIILSHLLDEGYAETLEQAQVIMVNMSEDWRESIVEARMDPRGRPASGPMNVYAKSKPNNDPAFQAALTSYREKEAKKTPEQRKAELDAYKARQMNR